MATARATLEKVNAQSSEVIVDFSPQRLKAPFALRIAALCVDYLLLLMLPVAWLVLARFFSDTGTPDGIGSTIWFIGFLLLVANNILLPMVNGQSLGKMIFGMHIVKMDGSRAGAMSILLRNVFGYTLTLCSAGLGFLSSAISMNGRTLHDFIAGTMVVRGRKSRVEN